MSHSLTIDLEVLRTEYELVKEGVIRMTFTGRFGFEGGQVIHGTQDWEMTEGFSFQVFAEAVEAAGNRIEWDAESDGRKFIAYPLPDEQREIDESDTGGGK